MGTHCFGFGNATDRIHELFINFVLTSIKFVI